MKAAIFLGESVPFFGAEVFTVVGGQFLKGSFEGKNLPYVMTSSVWSELEAWI